MNGDVVKIVVHSDKGGVGKTETVMRLGMALAGRGYRTLLVDCDPQADLTRRLDAEPSELGTQAMFAHQPWAMVDVGENLALVPSSPDLETVNEELGKLKFGQLTRLARIDFVHDVVLFDTQTPYEFLTLNAYVAAQWLLIPAKPVTDDLLGIMRVHETLESLWRAGGLEIPHPIGIVATMVRTNVLAYDGGLRVLRGDPIEPHEYEYDWSALRSRQGWPPLLGVVPQADGKMSADVVRNNAYWSIAESLLERVGRDSRKAANVKEGVA